jgi:RHH-type rel operon transcriptional repressor/antitoxin RelB
MATSIHLSAELRGRLDRLASRMGKSKADTLSQIVANGISEMEDYCQAAEMLDRVRNGKEAVFSSSAVRADLGLGD